MGQKKAKKQTQKNKKTDEEIEWRVHKDYLTRFSPVFKAMFEHQMQESLENTVTIDDFNGETMKYVILYMYTGTIPNDLNLDRMGPDLLRAADKYQIIGLSTLIFDFLLSKLSAQTACVSLILCKIYQGSE